MQGMAVAIAAKRYREIGGEHMHGPWRIIKYGCNIIIVFAVLLTTNTSAKSSYTVQRMSFAELNHLITQKQGACLLFFMAAWCGPCKEELPILNKLYHQFRNKGLRIIGISIDVGGPAAIERVLQKKQVEFSVYWVGERAVDEYNLVGIPMTYLIKKGQIVEKIPGKCSYKFLRGRIADLIK